MKPHITAPPKGRTMDFTNVRALSFDCYGTLIDWEAGLSVGLQKLAGLSNEPIATETLLDTYGEVEAGIERDHPTLLYPSVIARSMSETGRRHGIEIPDGLAEEIGYSVPDWPAFPDSADALTRLKENFQLIILSNVDRSSFFGSNRRLGVEFDAIFTAEEIGSYKPDPRNFEYFLERIEEMGIRKGELVHVAQSLFHDHVQARAFGLDTVWIDRRGDLPGGGATPVPDNAPTPTWTFRSMKEFADAAT